jgi:phage host-nuclease inhibitor protein Gam
MKTTTLERCRNFMSRLKDYHVKLTELQAEADGTIQDIQNDLNERSQPLKKAKEKLEKDFAAYVEENREEIFTGKDKSVATPFGAFGYRITPERIELDLNEPDVVDLIKSLGKKLTSLLVKVKETVDKTAVKKALKNNTLSVEQLQELGMRTESDELFSYAIDSQKL